MPKTMEPVPARLRRLRLAAGFTQESLARAAGVGLRTVCDVEQGRRELRKADAGAVLAVAQVLGVSVEELIG